jgi:hypothetical protein
MKICTACSRLPQFRPCTPMAKICGLCGRIDPTWFTPHIDIEEVTVYGRQETSQAKKEASQASLTFDGWSKDLI